VVDHLPAMGTENAGTRFWVRVIALWSLFGSVTGGAVYFLTRFGVLEGDLSPGDHAEFLVNAVLGLALFTGLWRLSAWGWKLAVAATPVAWIYTVWDVSRHYEPGLGLAMSIFVFIDVLILLFLFGQEVRRLFGISSGRWAAADWIVPPLFLTGVFLMVNDLFGSVAAIIAAAAAFAAQQAVTRWKMGR